MRKVVLFIAMSLDGYIARRDGGIDWLKGENPAGDDMESYREFAETIDTVVMGRNTYEQISRELSPGAWCYPDFTSYILTHGENEDTKERRFVNRDVCRLVEQLKSREGKDIWICGGAGIIWPLLQENLIDRYHISVIPQILGDGIRLFPCMEQSTELKLLKMRSYNGITDLIYEPVHRNGESTEQSQKKKEQEAGAEKKGDTE